MSKNPSRKPNKNLLRKKFVRDVKKLLTKEQGYVVESILPLSNGHLNVVLENSHGMRGSITAPSTPRSEGYSLNQLRQQTQLFAIVHRQLQPGTFVGGVKIL